MPNYNSLSLLPKDTLDDWIADPVAGFAQWIGRQVIEEETRKVKEFMWGKWCRYTRDKHIPLQAVTAADIEEFFQLFEGESIQKAHRSRYLKLIERTYAHLDSLGLKLSKNPGTDACLHKLGKGSNDLTVFLEEQEIEAIKKVIRQRMKRAIDDDPGSKDSEVKEEKKRKGRKKAAWIEIRDAALCAVMMGGGASVDSIERLSVSCTNMGSGRLTLPRKGGPAYEAPLLPLAQAALEAWLDYRERLGLGGTALFPADAGSRRNATTLTTTDAMSASAIFRATRSVLKDAGITGARACGQTLRNAYAGMLIDLGYGDMELQQAMGFAQATSALRLRSYYGHRHLEDASQPE